MKATHRESRGNDWHIPPKYFTPYPFADSRTFTVTRDPYERAISEYYQRTKFCLLPDTTDLLCHKFYRHFSKKKGPDDSTAMNTVLQEFVARPRGDMHVPQHHYIYDDHGNRIVDHVLEFKHLKEEFDKLMECYGIDMVLPT